jgi:poly(3-hydroxybutyrate) depolymerase
MTEDPANPLDSSSPRGVFAKVGYDRMLPEEGGNSWLRRDGCPPESKHTIRRGLVTFTTYEGKDGSEVLICLVEGRGHTWPSGRQYASAKGIGNVSYGCLWWTSGRFSRSTPCDSLHMLGRDTRKERDLPT